MLRVWKERADLESSKARLAQAISDFENLLSPEEATEARDHASQQLRMRDAMKLIADLNAASAISAADIPRSFCNSHLVKFLRTLKIYSNLADEKYKSTELSLGYAVWSSVKLTLLFLAKSHSPLENSVTRFFTNIGYCFDAKIQEAAIYYARSNEIQSVLHQFHTTLVQYCHHILQVSRSPDLGITYDQERFAYSLKRWQSCLPALNIVQATRQNKAEKAALDKEYFWADWNDFERFTYRYRHPDTVKRKLLEKCSQYDYESVWQNIRKSGSAKAFSECAEFKIWQESRQASTLLCVGAPGSGKTVLMANIVEHLYANLDDDAMVAYFFCKSDSFDSQHMDVILGSLARQLIEELPSSTIIDLLNADKEYSEERVFKHCLSNILPVDQTIRFLRNVITGPVFFVLDGLEYYHFHEEEGDIMKHLRSLQEELPLQLCISTVSQEMFQDDSRITSHVLPTIYSNREVEKFIESKFKDSFAADSLVLSNKNLASPLHQLLLEKSCGRFLWINLQFLRIQSLKSIQELQDFLSDVSSSMTTSYASLYGDGTQRQSADTILLFQLLLAAFEPLTKQQVHMAFDQQIKLAQGDALDASSRLIKALEFYRGFMKLDEQSQTVCFVHESACHFLMEELSDSEDTAHQTMAEISLAFLQDDDTMLKKTEFQSHQSTHSYNIASTLVHRLLRIQDDSQQPPSRQDMSSDAVELEESSLGIGPLIEHDFTAYARSYWEFHLMDYGEPSAKALMLLQSGLAEQKIDLHSKRHGPSPFHRAIMQKHSNLVTLFLQQRPSANDFDNALVLADNMDNTELIKTLVNHGRSARTMLRCAILYDLEHVFEILLSTPDLVTPASMKEVCYDRATPYGLALRYERTKMALQLLNDERFDYKTEDRLGPLELAVALASVDVLRAIIAGGKHEFGLGNQNEYLSGSLWNVVFDNRYRPGVDEPEYAVRAADVVQILLEAGYLLPDSTLERECRWRSSDDQECDNIQPLMVAAEGDIIYIIKAILEFDSSVVNNVSWIRRSSRFMLPNLDYSTALDKAQGREAQALLQAGGGQSFSKSSVGLFMSAQDNW